MATRSSPEPELAERMVRAIEEQAAATNDLTVAVDELREAVGEIRGDLKEAVSKLSAGKVLGSLFTNRRRG